MYVCNLCKSWYIVNNEMYTTYYGSYVALLDIHLFSVHPLVLKIWIQMLLNFNDNKSKP